MSPSTPRSPDPSQPAADTPDSAAELQRIVAAQARRIAELEAALASQRQIADELRRGEARLSVLAAASHAFAAVSADLADLCRAITRYVADTVGDLCSLRLLSPDRSLLIVGHTAHRDPEGQALAATIDPISQRADEGHTSQVVRDGRPLYIPAVPQEPFRVSVPPQFLPYLDRFGVASLIIVPLQARGRVIGTLTLTRDAGGAAYTPDDLAMLQDLADRAALAVSHAQALVNEQDARRRHADDIALLDAVYAHAPIGLAFLDAELRYVRANRMLAEMGGIPVEAYPGHAVGELFPALAPTIEPLHRHVLTTGEVIRDIAIRGTTPAAPDTPREWLASYYPVRGPDGAVVGVGVVAVDVTERTLAEAALRERTTMLELAADAAELGIWRRDFSGELVQLDARAQAHYGFDRAEGPIAEVLARAHPDDVAGVRTQIALAMEPARDGRYRAEYRMIHADGAIHWLLVHGRLFFADDAAGRRPLLAIGTSQDITARKQIEQQLRDSAAALRASEEHFRLLAEHAQDLIYRYRLSPEPGFEYVSPSATALTGYTPEEHYADPDLGHKLVHPDDRELLQHLSQDPAAAGAPIALRWQRKDGSVLWAEQINRVITDAAGVPVAIEGIARDITTRKEAEARVQAALTAEQAARKAAEQAAMYSSRLEALATALSAALTQDAVAAVVIEQGGSIAGASAVVLGLLDPSGEYVTVINVVGRDAALFRDYMAMHISKVPPLEHSIRTREPLWVSSPEEAEARFPGSGALMARFGDQAKATLPLVTGGRTIGVINLSFAATTSFSPQERALLTTLAQQCAQALDRARLYDEIVETRGRLQQLSQRLLEAQEQERRHIARELHDEVGQALGALKINLHMLGATPAGGADTARVAESLSIVDALIQQVRALSLELRPSVLDDLGLAAALEWYGSRLQQRSGLEVRFENYLGALMVPPLVATACFRIAQEALTNVVRHAHARRVTLTLSHHEALLTLGVCDDGVGFDVAAERSRAVSGTSLGLISMAERAELVGGWVDLSSAPGEGTELWAWLPLDGSGRAA